MSDEPREVRFLAGSGSIEEYLEWAEEQEQEAPEDEPIEVTARGGADPTDVDDSTLNLGFGPRDYDDNPVTPKGPTEATGAGEN